MTHLERNQDRPFGVTALPASTSQCSSVPRAGASRRVLVIEDNLDAAEALSMFLEVIGHEVQVAHNAAEGIAAAERWRPDVVLSDIGLPGDMDGYAVARALRGGGSAAGVYLVALSGYGQAQDKERALEAGFDTHMTKPVDVNALERMLAGVGGSSRA